jgi:hypothetical protein
LMSHWENINYGGGFSHNLAHSSITQFTIRTLKN